MANSYMNINFKDIAGYKSNVMYAAYTYSFFDEKDKRRKILKKDFTARKVAELVKDANKDNASKSIAVLKKDGYITEENGYYIIQDNTHISHVILPTDFAKELIKKRNSETVMVYLWLHKRFENWKQGKRNSPTFTHGDIIKQCFNKPYSTHWNNKVRDILHDLVISGLISYNVIRHGNTFLRCLTSVNECFATQEVMMAIEKQLLAKYQLNESQNFEADPKMEEIEVLGKFGLPAADVPKLLEQRTYKQLAGYDANGDFMF